LLLIEQSRNKEVVLHRMERCLRKDRSKVTGNRFMHSTRDAEKSNRDNMTAGCMYYNHGGNVCIFYSDIGIDSTYKVMIL